MKAEFYRSVRLYQITEEESVALACALKILLRERRARRLGLPEDADDPPALAVVHQLYAVDAARERLRVVGLVSALVRAPSVDDMAVGFDAARDLFFVEALLGEKFARALDVAVNVVDVRRIFFRPGQRRVGRRARRSNRRGRHQTRARNEERAHPVPVAPLARGAGDKDRKSVV